MHLYTALFILAALACPIGVATPLQDACAATTTHGQPTRKWGPPSSSDQTFPDHGTYLRMLRDHAVPDELDCLSIKPSGAPRPEVEKAIDGFCKGTIGPEMRVMGDHDTSFLMDTIVVPGAGAGSCGGGGDARNVSVELSVRVEWHLETVLGQDACVERFRRILSCCDASGGGHLWTEGVLYFIVESRALTDADRAKLLGLGL
ncbi:uncharacterized protein BKCO1_260006 [Diplodia corticola]|uniref:Uncharacterized protein n=1 Tax=Diplodia corticola TaxID=236234 RepID=A0A1J9QZS5_9PEZI|nr:uncharacterized protein BKCO1_260006 [Diplodia corticola]OJD33888.1 hypothetical protein BKCO1_260006 [Diplodia corticola]